MPKPAITYAQYDEDIILSALLHDVSKGFYVDVGANDPDVDSVTKLFYKRGWRGINIEPIERLYDALARKRPRDINIHCGAGSKAGVADFREYIDVSGHSTFDNRQKRNEKPDLPHKDYKVRVRTLAEILRKYKPEHIHFLKIDVEGYEYDVIEGNDWNKFRPEIICVEANHVHRDWGEKLGTSGYKLFIKDGLNEYYLDTASWHRTDGFADRVTALSYRSIKQHHWKVWSRDLREFEKLKGIAAERERIIKRLDMRLQEVEPLSLKNHSLKSRVRIALSGITVDWIRFKKARAKKR